MLEAIGVVSQHRLARMDVEARVLPREQHRLGLFAQSLRAAQLAQHEAAEHLAQRMLVPPRNALERNVLACGIDVERAPGHERVHMRMEVHRPNERKIVPERLGRCHRADLRSAIANRLAQHALYGLVGTAREDRQQSPLALEQAARDLRHREHHVAMGNVGQHSLDQVLREQRRALGLATRTEVAGLATEREQVLTATTRTTDACEAALGAAALEVLLDDATDDAA